LRLLLDTMIVSALCTPRDPSHGEISGWLRLLAQDSTEELTVMLPEIVDYEVRRGLLHVARRHGRSTTRNLQRLDELTRVCEYCPIETPVMRRAAELWAEARVRGEPTDHEEGLDGDVILAAQAQAVGGIVVTENVRHLGRYVEAKSWRDVGPRED